MCLIAFRSLRLMAPLNDLIAYRWWVRFQQRGVPSVQVVMLLNGAGVTADQLLEMIREFCEYEDVSVIVTQCSAAFWSICAVGNDDVVDVDDDDDGDDDDDDNHDDDDDDDADADDDDLSARSIPLTAPAIQKQLGISVAAACIHLPMPREVAHSPSVSFS
jgi:hypothetical protein